MPPIRAAQGGYQIIGPQSSKARRLGLLEIFGHHAEDASAFATPFHIGDVDPALGTGDHLHRAERGILAKQELGICFIGRPLSRHSQTVLNQNGPMNHVRLRIGNENILQIIRREGAAAVDQAAARASHGGDSERVRGTRSAWCARRAARRNWPRFLAHEAKDACARGQDVQ